MKCSSQKRPNGSLVPTHILGSAKTKGSLDWWENLRWKQPYLELKTMVSRRCSPNSNDYMALFNHRFRELRWRISIYLIQIVISHSYIILPNGIRKLWLYRLGSAVWLHTHGLCENHDQRSSVSYPFDHLHTKSLMIF